MIPNSYCNLQCQFAAASSQNISTAAPTELHYICRTALQTRGRSSFRPGHRPLPRPPLHMASAPAVRPSRSSIRSTTSHTLHNRTLENSEDSLFEWIRYVILQCFFRPLRNTWYRSVSCAFLQVHVPKLGKLPGPPACAIRCTPAAAPLERPLAPLDH
jgi:hypothetical protein